MTNEKTTDSAASALSAGLAHKHPLASLDGQAAKVVVALSTLATVEQCLRFLAKSGVVKEESVSKGCRKYVKDHPEIQAWIDSDRFMDDMGANVRSQATDAALSRQVACTDGLGAAVPSAPTFGQGENDERD